MTGSYFLMRVNELIIMRKKIVSSKNTDLFSKKANWPLHLFTFV